MKQSHPDAALADQILPAHHVRDWSAQVLIKCGMPQSDAETTASVLTRTSLRRYDGHGVTRLPLYASRILAGEVNPRPHHHGELRDGTIFYSSDNGLGQVIASAAMHSAIEATKTRPIVSCLMEGCGHLSALGTFTLQAAEAGRVAFLCQPTKPWVAMVGWTSRAIGNNPISFAAPVVGKAPLVFDMAASVVSRGAVMDSKRDGKPIPFGWAIGPDGASTTDAAEAADGSMLPIGGYKGIGLAMLVECLGASLMSRLGEEPGVRSRPGAFLLVANPALTSGADFGRDMATWLARYQEASPDGAARYPGQRAAECEAQRSTDGIPIPHAFFQDLARLGEKTGIPLGHPD